MIGRLEQLVIWLGTACFALLFVLMVAQVILRYGFSFTPFFTEEIARYAMIWAALAGAAVATRRGAHIRVDFVSNLLPSAVRRIWQLVLDLGVIGLFGVLVVKGIESSVFLHSQASMGLQIPLSYPTLAVPFFFTIAAVFAAAGIGAVIRKRE